MTRGVYKGLLDDPTRIDYLFRVSLEAVIHDQNGRLLVTNEANRPWHLPGGGLEHGETIDEGLKRELAEEIGYPGSTEYEVIGVDPMYMGEALDMWQLWVVLDVVIDSFDFMDSRSRLIDEEELAHEVRHDSHLTYVYAKRASRKSGK